MKIKNALLILTVLLLLAGNISAQESEFPEKLQLELQQRNWNREEVQNMLQICRTLDWEGTNPAHAEISALALQMGLEKNENLSLNEQAQLALHVALQSREMERAGLSDREIAGVVMRSTREMYREINRNRHMYQLDNIGETIDQCVKAAIQNQLRISNNSMVQMRDGSSSNTSPSLNSGSGKKGKKP